MENSWKTHGISLQQFGRHSGVVAIANLNTDQIGRVEMKIVGIFQQRILVLSEESVLCVKAHTWQEIA